MDVWIVAAAAGAGYIAQNWKNILRGRQDLSSSFTESPTLAVSESSPFRQQFTEKNCPLRRVVSGKKVGEDTYLERAASCGDIPVEEVASTSGCDGANFSILDTSMSLSGEILNENLQGGQDRVSNNIDGSNGDLSPQPSKGEMGFSYDPASRKRALRARRTRGQFIKPLSSLESCLMAQLYKEHTEIEDYVFSSVHSPRTPTLRPFLVSDGSRIISRGSGDCLSLPLEAVEEQPDKKTSSQGKTIYGVPQLPKIKDMNFQRRAKLKSGQDQVGRSSNYGRRANGKHQKLQGSSDGALLFCLGISMGIISAFLGNRREVHKLNELLKQTENLVQDLQEELEMKDSLTVKELAVEDSESQDTHNDSLYDRPLHAYSPEHELDESTERDHSKCHDEKVDEKSLSKIEAELEAELERLELNMNASSLEAKLTDLVELDPDCVPEVAVGELRADLFGQRAGAQHYADEDGSGSSTTHSANYAVSPRELSLRLHEVVQSRLEERVKELETALQNSQRKVKHMEYEHRHSWRNLSSSEVGSSAQGSPVNKDEQPHADHPVVINLSGEALDAYNEAYDIFTRINDSEEDKPSRLSSSGHRKGSHPCDQSPDTSLNGKPSTASDYREEEAHNTLSNDMGTSREESDHSHDEMEELLIKHIVEQARKGSSVVVNAQRALVSNDEN